MEDKDKDKDKGKGIHHRHENSFCYKHKDRASNPAVNIQKQDMIANEEKLARKLTTFGHRTP